MTIPTDNLYGLQWHFGIINNNGFDSSLQERLWDEYTGAGVAVGARYSTRLDKALS